MCGDARIARYEAGRQDIALAKLITQRESSATIKAAPATYEQSEPAKAKNIIEIDCRGLEFTEFKADVSTTNLVRDGVLKQARENGRPKA